MSRIKTGMYQGPRLRQEMKTNPRLYQAMDLIYMPLLELQTRMEQELAENPFLELSEPDDDEDLQVGEEGQEETDDEMDWDEILLDGFDAGGTRERYEPREFYQPPAVEIRHLHDLLADQIALVDLDDRQAWIAAEIIGNIDDDGLLTCSVQDVADSLNGTRETLRETAMGQVGRIEDEQARKEEEAEVDRLFAPLETEEIDAVLRVVQSLDPSGVGARDLRECLMIQMTRGRQGGLADLPDRRGSPRRPAQPQMGGDRADTGHPAFRSTGGGRRHRRPGPPAGAPIRRYAGRIRGSGPDRR